MNEITAVIPHADGKLELDFAGDFEGTCCANPSQYIKDELAKLGVHLTVESVRCRLPQTERLYALRRGECIETKAKE